MNDTLRTSSQLPLSHIIIHVDITVCARVQYTYLKCSWRKKHRYVKSDSFTFSFVAGRYYVCEEPFLTAVAG